MADLDHIDTFAKLELRVAKVLEGRGRRIPPLDKLLLLLIDVGDQQKQIVVDPSALHAEQLRGEVDHRRQQPRAGDAAGEASNGMLLAATSGRR